MSTSPPPKRPLPTWSIVLVIASALGWFFAAQMHYSSAAFRRSVTWGQSLYWALGDWYEWALLAPIIFWLSRRFSFGRNHLPSSLGIHLVAGVGPDGIRLVQPKTAKTGKSMAQTSFLCGWLAQFPANDDSKVQEQQPECPGKLLRFPGSVLFGSGRLLISAVLILLAARAGAQPWSLETNVAFTKITLGTIVSDHGNTYAGSWGDYNNDGFLDLVAANGAPSFNENEFLYRNEGSNGFTKIAAVTIVTNGGISFAAAWGDFDNDGYLDLFIPNLGQKNFLYRNNADGSFAKVTTGTIANDVGNSVACAWGDYDNDGFLDLFVANRGGQRNSLYHNNGDGTFTKIITGILVTEVGSSEGCAWGDYDNDGFLDLFVPNYGQRNFLYHNNRDGTFAKMTTGAIATDVANSVCAAWGDYDNDGYLDLFVSVFGGNNILYRNNGDGTFTRIIAGSIVTDGGSSVGCTWGDYDNDGNLDLFVSNSSGQRNFLYHNDGNAKFTKVAIGNIVTDVGDSIGCAWGDYDNDGFLDLFVANRSGLNNFLYHNDGNHNHWLRVKCIGTVSNRTAIGAKVRIKATIAGIVRWQLRQISGGDGENNSDSLIAQFGLGDATVIDRVRLEWPSGAVQELTNMAVNQTLIITEPPRLSSGQPVSGSGFAINLIGGIGFGYAIQASTDMTNWTSVAMLTNSSRSVAWADADAAKHTQQFYRAIQLPGVNP